MFVILCSPKECLHLTVQDIAAAYRKVTDALDLAIRREISVIIARIHKVDFAKPVDPMSMGSRGGSPYMQDLIDKLNFVKTEILGRMSMGDYMRDWCARCIYLRCSV